MWDDVTPCGMCNGTGIKAPRVEARKKQMPRTRHEFCLAAIWLGRKAARAADVLSACLAGPAADDEENGICLGYRDGRDLK